MSATSLPPGPRVPAAIQTARWLQRKPDFVESCARRYGDAFTVRVLGLGPWVYLSHPDAVKTVFTGDPKVLRAGEGNALFGPMLGASSLLLLDGAAHLRKRKLLLPPFHGRGMARLAQTMADVAQSHLARWPAGRQFATWPSMQAIALEVIMRTIFGLEDGAHFDRVEKSLRRLLERANDRMLLVAVTGRWRRDGDPLGSGALRRAREELDALLLDEIDRRRRAPDLEERSDILSLLLRVRGEDGAPLTDAELCDELVLFMFAGHETTASSMTWVLERLARHPEVLERLRDELTAGSDTFLDAVIKETLRLRPAVHLVARRLAAPFEVAGHRLPAGVTVVPHIHLLHRRPDVYPEPERFRPERFLERPAGTYTWIPFGGGVRRCLGASFALLEMKQVLGTILPRVELRAERGREERMRRRTATFVADRGGRLTLTAAR